MRNQLRSIFLTLFVAAVMGAVAIPALAQPQQGDPPGVAGRLSFMQGPVSMQPGGVDDWVDATLNRPLTTSDRLWADQGGRAEVSMGNVKARIDQETSMTIVNLDDQISQLQLDQGTMAVHVRRLFEGESVEIDTPNVAFVINREGDYRFDVDPNADTTYVSVRRGEGEGTGEAEGVRVSSGQQVVFSGGNSGQSQYAELGDPDEFDQWNMQRDRRQDNSQSARYVSPGTVGYDDLDDYGSWNEDPQYGPVWRPRVEAGWAPYRQGHWAWIDPWGYTWVDDAPWGFAPFHYGRWVSVRGGWGWCPGPREEYRPGVAYVRPVYAPALVAFIGGNNWGVSISVGGGGGGPVGWVPLSYGEPYYPSYRVSNNYVRNVNVTNTHITNITNVTNNYTVINNNNTTVINNNNNQRVVYRNAQVPGAVTAVPANAMASGRPVNQVAVKVDQRQIQQARFSVAPPVAPTKETVLGGRATAQQHVPPPSAINRPVMTQHAPPPAPVKFEAKQQLLVKNAGRPLTQSEVKSLPTVQRPTAMTAGKPRPAAAVQQIKSEAAAAPKTGARPMAVRPPAAKPTPGGANPANAGRPGAPGSPNAGPNTPKPGTTGEPNPANAGRPGTPGARPNPADNRPGNAGSPADRNAPKPPSEVNRPNGPAGNPASTAAPKPGTPPDRNVPRPPASNAPATANPNPSARPNEAASPSGRPIPHPPTRDNGPGRPDTTGAPAAHPASRPATAPDEPSRTAPESRGAAPATRPAPEPRTATPPPRTAPESHSAAPPPRPTPEPRTATPPPRQSTPPPAAERNVPRPPERQAAPPAHNPPPAKDNKPAPKDNKKPDNKDEKPQ